MPRLIDADIELGSDLIKASVPPTQKVDEGQIVFIARSLSLEPMIVLLDDPTRGIDVGAKAEVHELLNQLTAQGCGVLLVSSELPEVLAMSDRVIVMYRGQMRAVIDHQDADHELVMGLATGADVAATTPSQAVVST